MAAREHTRVGRLRVRASPLAAAAAPARVAGLLAGADLRPRRLAPGAVLCVRRLADPAPGTLRTDTSSVRLPDRWRELAVASLDEALGRAARPALGAVPAAADSVLFADQGELLAALAREWCEGTALTCWWWRSLAASVEPGVAVPSAWLAAAEAVPAALARLADDGRAQAFVRRLDAGTATAMARALAERYGLRTVVAALGTSTRFVGDVHEPPRAAPRSARPVSPVPLPDAPLVSPRRSRAPAWIVLVPEALDSELEPAQRELLTLCLLLSREPTLAREPRFGRELVRWAEAPERAADPPEGGPAARPRRAPPRVDGATLRAVASGAVGSGAATPAGDAPRREPRGAAASSTAPALEPTARVALPSTARAARPAPRAPISQRAAETTGGVPAGDRAPEVLTSLGGVVMLVNAAIALELYGDFASPLRPGIRLDPWHFLALAGRGLLGRRSARRFGADPLWDLLAELGGRRPLGAGFRAPARWRLPSEWLDVFERDARSWVVTCSEDRLRIRHPAGFAVVDVPAAADVRRQLDRLLRRYRSPAVVTRRHSFVAERRPLERWLDWLLPYLRARLRLALGADPAERLLPIPATVRCGAERLDVDISLSQLPVEVRLAGLDRDPGWFPAGGRTIAFHFA